MGELEERIDQLEVANEELRAEILTLQERLHTAMFSGSPSTLDRKAYQFPLPKMTNLYEWLPTFANRSDFAVVEIGSREVRNKSRIRETLPLANYTGFDLYSGPNVDLVGDAHRLSTHIEPNSVDLIISSAVFEHLAMPWLVVEEMSKVLRLGGLACTMTHFSYSEHEKPWHFFQFNDKGLEVLFNRHLGFETIESGKGMPMVGRFAYDSGDQAGKPIGQLYATSYIITRKTAPGAEDFQWRDAIEAAYAQTEYPRNTGLSKDWPQAK